MYKYTCGLMLFNSWLRNWQYTLPVLFSLTCSISAKHVTVDQKKPLVGWDPHRRILPVEKSLTLIETWQMWKHLLHWLSLCRRVCRKDLAQQGSLHLILQRQNFLWESLRWKEEPSFCRPNVFWGCIAEIKHFSNCSLFLPNLYGT